MINIRTLNIKYYSTVKPLYKKKNNVLGTLEIVEPLYWNLGNQYINVVWDRTSVLFFNVNLKSKVTSLMSSTVGPLKDSLK